MIEINTQEKEDLFFKDIDGREVRVGDKVLVAWMPDYDNAELSRGEVVSISKHSSIYTYEHTREVSIKGLSGHPNKDNHPFEYESSLENSQIILKLEN